MQPHSGQPVVYRGKPLAQSDAAMVMVHGRGAGPPNILELADQFDLPEFTYVAPGAAGQTWYPFSFMEERDKNEPGLSSGLYVIDRLITDLVAGGLEKKNLVLLGFSQGGCLTAEYAVRHADRFGGVIIYSGGLIGPPGTTWSEDGSFDGMPVFLGCSDVDAHVPQERVDESARVFSEMGADVTKRIYPGMGHLVIEEELDFARELMRDIVGAKR